MLPELPFITYSVNITGIKLAVSYMHIHHRSNMKQINQLVLAGTLGLLPLSGSFAAPNPITKIVDCSPAVNIAPAPAAQPVIFSDGQGGHNFVIHAESGLLGKSSIRYTNFGADKLPGTADDTSGYLTNAAPGVFDFYPSTDGRFVAFVRYAPNSFVTRMILIDLGLDELPGTPDDQPEIVLDSYPTFLSFGGDQMITVNDGLVGWYYVNTIPISGAAPVVVGMCDAKLPATASGGCGGPVLNIPISPSLTPFGKVTVVRDNSLGFPLNVGLMRVAHIISTSPIVIDYSTLLFEPHLGLLMPWGNGDEVKIRGLLGNAYPLYTIKDQSNIETNILSDSALIPTNITTIPSISVGVKDVLWQLGRHARSVSGQQPVLWTSYGGPAVKFFTQDLLGSELHQVKFPVINPYAQQSPTETDIDGDFLTFTYQETTSSMFQYGVWVSNCR